MQSRELDADASKTPARGLVMILRCCLLGVCLVGLGACEKDEAPTATAAAETPAPAAPPAESADNKKGAAAPAAKPDEGDEAAAVATPGAVQGATPVTVSTDGSKFDPPVKIDQIPDGAWMCDMGTVHYARLEKGDGKCALCKMDLVRKGAAGH